MDFDDNLNVVLSLELCSGYQHDGKTADECLPIETTDVKNETSTEIHVRTSDCKRTTESSEEVSSISQIHRVVIQGSMANAERARRLLRAATPVELVFSCRANKIDSLGQQLLSAHISTVFAIRVTFVLIAEDESYQIVFHGNRWKFDILKQAALHFCHITQIPSESVETQFYMSNDHATLVRDNLGLIEMNTGVMLRCPLDDSLVLVRGSIDSVFHAGEFIEGMAPVGLNFTADANRVDLSRIQAIASAMDILISIHELKDCVQLLAYTYEWNTRFLYEIWRIATGSPSAVVPLLPDSWLCFDESNIFTTKLKDSDWPSCYKLLLEDTVLAQKRNTGSPVLRSPERSPVSSPPLSCRENQQLHDPQPAVISVMNSAPPSPIFTSCMSPSIYDIQENTLTTKGNKYKEDVDPLELPFMDQSAGFRKLTNEDKENTLSAKENKYYEDVDPLELPFIERSTGFHDKLTNPFYGTHVLSDNHSTTNNEDIPEIFASLQLVRAPARSGKIGITGKRALKYLGEL